MTRNHKLWIGAACALACCAPLFAQSESVEQSAKETTAEDASSAKLREHIEVRLKRAQDVAAECQAALEKLDRGEAVDASFLERDRGRFGNRMDAEGPGGFHMRDGGEGDRHAEMPTLDEVRAFVQEKLPWLAERLDKSESGSRDEWLRRLTPRIADVMRSVKEDPEYGALKIEQFRLGADWYDLAREIREKAAAGEITREEAASRFRVLAERHVALREKLSAHEAVQLKSRIEELTNDLIDLAARRSEIIADMTNRMVERAFSPKRWGWRGGDDQGGPGDEDRTNQRRSDDRDGSRPDDRGRGPSGS